MQCKNKKCLVELPNGVAFCYSCGRKQEASPRKTLKRANGTGTVYKLSGRRKRPWVAVKDKTIIDYYETKMEALDVLERLRGKNVSDRYNLTLAEVYELWKVEHFRTLTPSGQEMYTTAYKNFSDIKGMRMRIIRAEDFQSIVDAQIARGLSRSAMEKVKQLAGQLSKWAIREGLTEVNHAQFIILPKQEKTEKEIFTDTEIELLLKNDCEDAVKLILVLIYTGMRIGELMSVEKHNVHLDDGFLVAGSKTEAGKDRIIPIADKIANHVRYFHDNAPNGGLLIDGFKGSHTVNSFRRREYYNTLDRLGIIRKTPHSTRHTFASLMSRAEVRPEVLQKIIGHADYSTTANIYVHSDIEELKSAIQKL